jgi:DNA-binding transcriptional regulator GbsR (MarR family)
MNILQFIAQDGFIMLNKSIIKIIGLHESIVLGAFASKQNYNEGWFYFTYEEIEEITTLSKHQASKAIENLINSNILIDKREGVPCRRYFMLQVDELVNCLSLKNLTTGSKEIKPLVVKKLNDIIISNNTYNKNTKDNTYNNIKEVIDHFNKVTNSKSKGTKEVLANIEFLLKTYSVAEIKKVIDFIANDNWYIENKYVTLSTIFKRAKFNDKFERANCALVANQKPSYHTMGDFTNAIPGEVEF